jgi:hypothetical protein
VSDDARNLDLRGNAVEHAEVAIPLTEPGWPDVPVTLQIAGVVPAEPAW